MVFALLPQMSHTHLSEDIFLFGGDKVLLVSFKRFIRCYSLSHNSFKYSAIEEDDMSEAAFHKNRKPIAFITKYFNVSIKVLLKSLPSP